MKRRSFLAMLGLSPAIAVVSSQTATASPDALLADTVGQPALAKVDASGIDPCVSEAIVKAVRDYDRYLLPSRIAHLNRDRDARG